MGLKSSVVWGLSFLFLLTRLPHSLIRKMTFGKVNELGQFIREAEPEPDVKKSKGKKRYFFFTFYYHFSLSFSDFLSVKEHFIYLLNLCLIQLKNFLKLSVNNFASRVHIAD